MHWLNFVVTSRAAAPSYVAIGLPHPRIAMNGSGIPFVGCEPWSIHFADGLFQSEKILPRDAFQLCADDGKGFCVAADAN